MSDAKTLEELAFAKYWDERYAKPDAEESFEWFKSYENLRGFLGKWLPEVKETGQGEVRGGQPSILHLGCGNSVSSVSSVCHGTKGMVRLRSVRLTDLPDITHRPNNPTFAPVYEPALHRLLLRSDYTNARPVLNQATDHPLA